MDLPKSAGSTLNTTQFEQFLLSVTVAICIVTSHELAARTKCMGLVYTTWRFIIIIFKIQ